LMPRKAGTSTGLREVNGPDLMRSHGPAQNALL
jgi:hypothetical protein